MALNRTLKWRVPLVAAVTAVSFYLVYPPFDPTGADKGKLKLGLDLQGGMHLVLHVMAENLPDGQREDATERALEIIRNRIDQFGVSEPSIQRHGENQIIVQLPGVTDRQRALDLIGRTALLEFKLVAEKTVPQDQEKLPSGLKVHKQKDGTPIVLEDRTLLEGKTLTDARVQYSSDWNEPAVSVTLDSKGAKAFADLTSQYVNRQLAIVLDGVVQSAPVIREPILSGEAQISGSFSMREASDLAITLRAGALPAPIRIEEERTVGATLGKDSVEQGIRATLMAGVLVMVFMAAYYLMSGVFANLALFLNVLFIGACLAYFRATLTLPGIAGIILTIGMAVDTNVLILERVREELKLGKAVRTAVDIGYRRAFSAIFDSNLTTLITAVILFNLGTGPVRGFALTLAVGIVASFFTGIFCTRVMTDLYTSFAGNAKLRMLSVLRGVPRIDFLKPRRIFYAVSALVIAGSLAVCVRSLDKRYGIDFTGGVLYEYRFKDPVKIDEMRAALAAVGLEKAIIQQAGEGSDIIIRAPQGDQKALDDAIGARFQANPRELIRIETVGPIVGRELRKKSLWAAFFSILSILVYLAFRFEFRYSFAAVVALFHDAIVCLGAVVLTGREVSIPVLAAVLTIIGYSVNDTIVNFDRVRENMKKQGKLTYAQVVNLSINETLSRTILTSFTVLLVVAALFFFGGPVINDFAFTMLVGLVSGTYSTVFVACPMVVDWPGRRLRK